MTVEHKHTRMISTMRHAIDWTLHLAGRQAEALRTTLRRAIPEREDPEPPIHQPRFTHGSRCGNQRPLRTPGCTMIVALIGDYLPDE